MYRISIKQYREDNGYEDRDDWLAHKEHLVMDSVCPALCSDGCEVEPDGRCSHGHPSVLIALGLI